MGVSPDAESVPELMARNTEAPTPEPDPEPQLEHSEEPTRSEPDNLLYL